MDISVTIDFAPLARELGLPEEQLLRTVELLDEGNTVPFITRYRKDRTGGLDEEQIRAVQDVVTRHRMLAERKRTILKSIESQNKLTDELAQAITQTDSTKRLEDLYLPFKPKKQTLATVAREKGLEPLEREILGAEKIAEDLDLRSRDFINEDKGVRSQADVLLGVGHLIAEHFSERADLREALRAIVRSSGKIVCSKIVSNEEKTPAVEEGGAKEESKADANAKSETRPDAPAEVTPQASAAASPDVQEEPTEGAAPSTEGSAPSTQYSVPSTQPAEGESPTDDTNASDSAGNAASLSDAGEQSPTPEATTSAGEASTEEATSPPDAVVSPATDAPSPPAEPDPAIKAQVEKQRKEKARAQRRKQKEEEKKRKKKKKESAYKDYFDFEQPLGKLPPHRILAINRGERARVLRVKLDADQEAMRAKAEELAIPAEHPHREFLRGCLKDALNRLIFPALEREVRRELTDKAEEHAVTVFARNLRKLLLMPPVARHRVLAVDPGFKSGCKLAALDEFGNLHGHGAIYLVGPAERQKRSRARLVEMITMHKITVVAIGNGTACRETERLVADVLADELKDADVQYVIVNEAGASVYSTSPVGREELGQYEAAQRSAVSIGRRLLDPLSELVKINPANIGVGLYQHDMKAKHLQDTLDAVVESCVNYVGVDLNTASPSLLKYVSGLNQLTARRLYEYRQQHGPFTGREQLKDVPGVGEATFVQAAGFLRIAGGDNPLDATWIHPESYDDARRVMAKLDCSEEELARQVNAVETAAAARRRQAAEFAKGIESAVPAAAEEAAVDSPEASAEAAPQPATDEQAVLSTEYSVPAPPEQVETPEAPSPESTSPLEPAVSTEHSAPTTPEPPAEAPPPSKLLEKASQADAGALAAELAIGDLLCRDILGALKRPGRDPREDLPPPIFRREILKFEDLKEGMELAGTVLNVVDFGAFVDIGLHDTGLVHISRLADRYIKDPHEVVGVGDTLTVWVMGVDKQRRRVQLTAIKPGTEKSAPPRRSERRPMRRDAQDKDKRPGGEKSKDRRPRRKPDRKGGGRGRRDERPQRSGPFELTSKKEKKAKLTKAMKEGRAPLRTFGDLKQFIDLKEEPPEAPKEIKEEKPPKKREQSPPKETESTDTIVQPTSDPSKQAGNPQGDPNQQATGAVDGNDATAQSPVDAATAEQPQPPRSPEKQTASSQSSTDS